MNTSTQNIIWIGVFTVILAVIAAIYQYNIKAAEIYAKNGLVEHQALGDSYYWSK